MLSLNCHIGARVGGENRKQVGTGGIQIIRKHLRLKRDNTFICSIYLGWKEIIYINNEFLLTYINSVTLFIQQIKYYINV